MNPCCCSPRPAAPTGWTPTTGKPRSPPRTRSPPGGPNPTPGIWEIDNQPWTHSRLICVAGLRAVARLPHAGRSAGDWLALADKITADTAANAVHPDGRWQRSPQDPALDAALLLPPLRGGIEATDPRTIATLAGYLTDLTRDGYAYRFRHDNRPLADAEGSFTLCGFLVALALHQQHRHVEAARWYERTRACAGPPELYSEEFDVHQHQLRGQPPASLRARPAPGNRHPPGRRAALKPSLQASR